MALGTVVDKIKSFICRPRRARQRARRPGRDAGHGSGGRGQGAGPGPVARIFGCDAVYLVRGGAQRCRRPGKRQKRRHHERDRGDGR
jgi:hypothetical protein